MRRAIQQVQPRIKVYDLAACVSLLLLVATVLWPVSARAEDGPSFGPLFDHFDLTLTPGERTEAVSPFYYREERDTQTIWGLPPFFASAYDPEMDSRNYVFLYPLLSYHRYGEQYRWQLGQLFSFAGGRTQTETRRDRFTLYPLYFHQRSSDTNQSYTAVGPFYGHLQNRFFRDEIDYVMFPLYSRTRKADVVTRNYLFPIFHVRHGNRLNGWQFWPLFGQEEKDVTTRTNNFQEVESIPAHDKTFALWPIFYNEHLNLGSENPQWQIGAFPFYHSFRSPLRDQTTVLWPFFSVIDEREKNYHEWQALWPAVVFARGPGKTTSRVLPLFSVSSNTNLESESYMWPVYHHSRIKADPLDRQRTQILFFLFSHVVDRSTETGVWRRRVDLWPLFTHKRDLKGNTRLQILAPIEPVLPENTSIEREYAPVWSLWRSERNAETGATSQSLLWNLYRRQTTPSSSRVSAFFGLYQSRRDAGGQDLRVLFIPFKKHPRFADYEVTK